MGDKILKEIILAGVLSSAAYSQVQLGHNLEIETKGPNDDYWSYKDRLTQEVISPREIMSFSIEEKFTLYDILGEISLDDKFREARYPVYISKGLTSWEIVETLMEDKGKFSEIILDYRAFGDSAKRFVEKENLEVSPLQFQKYVLTHELVHAYYNHKYDFPKNNTSAIIPHPHYVAIAVECIEIINDDNMETDLYRMRFEQLEGYLGISGFKEILGKEEEIKKIRTTLKDWMEPEDYKFLFE